MHDGADLGRSGLKAALVRWHLTIRHLMVCVKGDVREGDGFIFLYK